MNTHLLAKSLFLFGCLPFFVLGVLHIFYTIADIWQPKKLIPYKPELISAMKASTLALTKETDMWRTWVGFNISHGLGLVFYSVLYAYLTTFYFPMLANSVFLLTCAPLLALIYLVLSKKYWFSIPVFCSLVGLLCFCIAALMTGISM